MWSRFSHKLAKSLWGLNSSLQCSNLQRNPGFDLCAAWNNSCILQCPIQVPLVISLPLISTRVTVMSSDLPSFLDEAMGKTRINKNNNNNTNNNINSNNNHKEPDQADQADQAQIL
ncbi:unnamed protein product [Polarella glacialis]|uniref:Uncharacterized protein n=1 Tax=Polarella glacialis TaxID=89957 RepID=A0A813JDW8_POLGL|nr:unnamed protein product [Polarella glacialis]